MHSLTSNFLSTLRYDGRQVATLRALGEYRGKQQLFATQSQEILSDLKQIAMMESTESSSRLEGIVIAPGRLKSLVIKNSKPKSTSEQKLVGYRDALTLIYKAAPDMPFSECVIPKLHSMLCGHTQRDGSHWIASNNDILDHHLDDCLRNHFQPTASYLSSMAMMDMVSRYRNAVDQNLADPLVLVPLSILDFLCIQPLPDGNGRVSRLLTQLLLYQFDYSVGRLISLERIFERSQESYYKSLEASSHGWHEGKHNVQPWLDYFWGALLSAYKELEEHVGNIDCRYGGKSARVRTEALKRSAPFSISEIEEACPGVSRDTVRLVLRSLKAAVLIESTGKGRSAKWKKINHPHFSP